MSSEINICNLALSSLGQGPITSITSPSNNTEQLCSLHYPICRDSVLEAANWTFANARATLDSPLVTAPNWGFTNQFELPTDCMRVIWAGRTTNEKAYDNFDWRVEGNQLLSNEAVIYIRYIKYVTDPSKFSPLFVSALAARMAMEMCIQVTENGKLYERLVNVYSVKLSEAAANDGAQGRSQLIQQKVLSQAR